MRDANVAEAWLADADESRRVRIRATLHESFSFPRTPGHWVWGCASPRDLLRVVAAPPGTSDTRRLMSAGRPLPLRAMRSVSSTIAATPGGLGADESESGTRRSHLVRRQAASIAGYPVGGLNEPVGDLLDLPLRESC